MSAAYVPQVGDRVRRTNWSDRLYMDTEYVGRSLVVGADPDGREMTATLSSTGGGEWVKVVTPAPLADCWYYVTTAGRVSLPKDTRADAIDHAGMNVLAVVHIWTDSDGVDRAEIERVTR